MRAFEEALLADDRSIVDYATSSSSQRGSPISSQSMGTTRIRKVSAMSDFAPVNVKVTRSASFCQRGSRWGSDPAVQTEKRLRSTPEETGVVVHPVTMAAAGS
jgi:hypothetical protein